MDLSHFALSPTLLFWVGVVLLLVNWLVLVAKHLDSSNTNRHGFVIGMQTIGLGLVLLGWIMIFGLHIGGEIPNINISPIATPPP